MSRCPTVSICLPVHNGAKYVRETIRSVLNQTFEDFELIISDNASTDETSDICSEIASCDSRIRYFRSPLNRGLAWNHNYAFQLTRGRYVMWLGHDDLLARDYITQCVRVLERDPGAVLCYTGTIWIDEQGSPLRKIELNNLGASCSSAERFCSLAQPSYQCEPIFGVMRKAALISTRLHGGFSGSDHVLLAEMGLIGRFSAVPKFLFFRRQHGMQTTKRAADPRDRTLVFDPNRAGKMLFPYLDIATGLLSAVNRAGLAWPARLNCYRHIVVNWIWNQRINLRRDLVLNLEALLQRHLSEEYFYRLLSLKRRFFKRPWTNPNSC